VATVLVVEDERKIRDLLRAYLEKAGHSVLTASSGAEGLELYRAGGVDLVVLDLLLPDIPGEEVARAIREERSQVGIVMLTAKSGEEDRIRGLEIGADDYLVKPFSPRELVLRVEAVLRRSRPESTRRVLSFGSGALVIDRERHEVWLEGRRVELTPTEWKLLLALAARPGRVFSRLELVNRVQGYAFEGYERTVDAHVKNLRRKLGDDPRSPRFIRTVLGAGYALAVGEDSGTAWASRE
jgi:two-component system alkaline phosphatase synthesis response regulator PhoP